MRLSASARLSTAMAKKTLRRISDVRVQENQSFIFITWFLYFGMPICHVDSDMVNVNV